MDGMAGLELTHFSDPGCPWAWSASPALSVLKWRYGDQLRWRHAMIGLTETGSVYEARGYTPHSQAQGYRRFRRRGMPFATKPRERIHGTWPMCRVVVATRRLHPDRELAVFRALQFAQFTSTLYLEDPAQLQEAIAWVPGIDPEAIVTASQEPETEAAFERDRDDARTAAGSPTELMGRTANYDGRVRYTAPSVVVTAPDGRRLEAGGFQPIEAYDIVVTNLDPSLERRRPATDVAEVLPAFPDGLTTMEVAAVMTPNNESPDRDAAEDALIALAAAGQATRMPFGNDALWVPPAAQAARLAAAA
jgi:2-hydroxychromene-2-carboxylate isomerase